jgi:hypothetical protein
MAPGMKSERMIGLLSQMPVNGSRQSSVQPYDIVTCLCRSPTHLAATLPLCLSYPSDATHSAYEIKHVI